jgi:hypothetical protein
MMPMRRPSGYHRPPLYPRISPPNRNRLVSEAVAEDLYRREQHRLQRAADMRLGEQQHDELQTVALAMAKARDKALALYDPQKRAMLRAAQRSERRDVFAKALAYNDVHQRQRAAVMEAERQRNLARQQPHHMARRILFKEEEEVDQAHTTPRRWSPTQQLDTQRALQGVVNQTRPAARHAVMRRPAATIDARQKAEAEAERRVLDLQKHTPAAAASTWTCMTCTLEGNQGLECAACGNRPRRVRPVVGSLNEREALDKVFGDAAPASLEELMSEDTTDDVSSPSDMSDDDSNTTIGNETEEEDEDVDNTTTSPSSINASPPPFTLNLRPRPLPFAYSQQQQ